MNLKSLFDRKSIILELIMNEKKELFSDELFKIELSRISKAYLTATEETCKNCNLEILEKYSRNSFE